ASARSHESTQPRGAEPPALPNTLLMRRLFVGLIGVAVMLGGIAIGLLLVEAGFRFQEWRHPPAGKGFFWVPSTEYGWGLAPGRAAPFYNDQDEFHTSIQINSKGLHDVEHDYDKPAGVFRILILGDS